MPQLSKYKACAVALHSSCKHILKGESKHKVIRGGHDVYELRQIAHLFLGGGLDGPSILLRQQLRTANYIFTEEFKICCLT